MEFLLNLGFWQRWFGPKRDDSRQAARDRLRGALVGDRSSVAPNLLPAMESDLEAVLARYFDFEKRQMKLALGEREGTMHFSVQLPVHQVHRQARLPKEALEGPPSRAQRRTPKAVQRGPRRRGSSAESQGE
jgi:cell division topological specificity factor MinE